MMFKLIILSGSRKGQRVDLPEAALTLGRDASCSMALDDNEVSGQHAVIERSGDGFCIRDLGSTNGTRVNDESIAKKNLKHGDVIQVGQTRFFVEASRPTRAGGLHGMQVLNRILVIVAFVGAPIAFVFLVAYLEDVHLGINRASLRPVRAAKEDAMSLTRALAVVPREEPIEAGEASTNREETGRGLSTGDAAWGEDAHRRQTAVRVVKIAGVEERSVTNNDEWEEMRVEEVRLARIPGQPEPAAESVRVDVSFFDRDTATGDIMPTDALVGTGTLRPEGPWGASESKSVRVTYGVPGNARKTGVDSVRTRQYFGCVVRVYCRDVLQDESAHPRKLLKDFPATGRGDGALKPAENQPAPSPVKAKPVPRGDEGRPL